MSHSDIGPCHIIGLTRAPADGFDQGGDTHIIWFAQQPLAPMRLSKRLLRN